MKHTERLVYKL